MREQRIVYCPNCNSELKFRVMGLIVDTGRELTPMIINNEHLRASWDKSKPHKFVCPDCTYMEDA